MKRVIIIICVFVGIISCEKDELIVPFEEKNWYFIEYRDNMDEVDQKIYDIYKKHGVAIFYHDTIGVEDRGWRDINGNINYHYEILKITYDPTLDMDAPFQYQFSDVSTLEKKKELLPVLDLLDQYLLPSITSIDVYLPCILLVDYINYGGRFEYLAKRSFNFMVVTKGWKDADEEPEVKDYTFEFLMEFMNNALESKLKIFYDYVYLSLSPLNIGEAYKKDPFATGYQYINTKYKEDYDNYKSYLDLMELIEERDELEELLQTMDPSDPEFDNIIIRISELNAEIAPLYWWKEMFETYFKERWEKAYRTIHDYGFLGFSKDYGDGLSYVPSKTEDLLMYLELALFSTYEEVYEEWGDYQYIIARYGAFYSVLDELMDIEQVRQVLSPILQ